MCRATAWLRRRISLARCVALIAHAAADTAGTIAVESFIAGLRVVGVELDQRSYCSLFHAIDADNLEVMAAEKVRSRLSAPSCPNPSTHTQT